MSKVSCTVNVDFTGAHRLVGLDIPCQALHGHYYNVSFTFESDKLDEDGMVIEFHHAENTIRKWFDDNWDHNIILHESDEELGESISKVTGQKIFYVPFNPTAENLGAYLLLEVCPELFKEQNGKCVKIHMQETPKYSATISL